eukprot:gene10434-11353_t
MSAVMADGSAVSSLVMVNLVGRRGMKLYTISPLSSSSYDKAVGRARERGVDVVKVVIEDFHNESDVIDLRRFGNGLYSIYSLEGVSYSVPPVVLLLSEWPVRMTVELRSVSSMSSLSGQNFLFSSGSSHNEEGETKEVVDGTIIVVLCVLVVLIGGTYYLTSSSSMKILDKKVAVMPDKNDNVNVSDQVENRNEIRASSVVDTRSDEQSLIDVYSQSSENNSARFNLSMLLPDDSKSSDDSMDLSSFRSLELSDDNRLEEIEEEEEEESFDGWIV